MSEVSHPVEGHDKGMLAILTRGLLTKTSQAGESPDKGVLAILVSLTRERRDD